MPIRKIQLTAEPWGERSHNGDRSRTVVLTLTGHRVRLTPAELEGLLAAGPAVLAEARRILGHVARPRPGRSLGVCQDPADSSWVIHDPNAILARFLGADAESMARACKATLAASAGPERSEATQEELTDMAVEEMLTRR